MNKTPKEIRQEREEKFIEDFGMDIGNTQIIQEMNDSNRTTAIMMLESIKSLISDKGNPENSTSTYAAGYMSALNTIEKFIDDQITNIKNQE